jgi:hypothetical protein
MKIHFFAGMLAISATTAALADLVPATSPRGNCNISSSAIRATSAPEARIVPSQAPTQPRFSEMRWTWMPVQATAESRRTAALIGQ